MREIELLAPAKNLQCGIAAIDHGADAVYIGADSFGARHAAGNSVEDIALLCRHAHTFGAKVYATVNTVVYDDETDRAVALLRRLHSAGVDAVLLQDMGLLALVRRDAPDLAGSIVWHASTQTDNRTAEKVAWLQAQGFRRAVLARELTLDEINAIHRDVPDMELEVFIHGALCVSYSGQCYASQRCFQRSANRGECAQMCRMRYSLIDAEGHSVSDDAYFLSLKDQCQYDNLEDIIDAGACSLKIEGRLKDVAYVKNVVAAYSMKLNDIIARRNAQGARLLARASWGTAEYSFTPDLRRSFNRGYTDYFLHGRHRDMASLLTPKAIGEYVGKVKEIRRGRQTSFNVAGTAAFVNGDGLCFIDSRGELRGFRVNRAEGNRLFPLAMPEGLTPGTPLYRSQDKAFDDLLSSRTAQRTIPLDIRIEDRGDSVAMTLTGCERHGTLPPLHGEATMSLGERQQAQKPQRENIVRQASRLGATAYSVGSISVDASLDNVFIPASMLSELRRKAIESIALDRTSEQERGQQDRKGRQVSTHDIPEDRYHIRFPYLHNATNHAAKAFYNANGISAEGFETMRAEKGGKYLLMQCRYCIRHALGHCKKTEGKAEWREPLSLRLADGRTFTLEFDCKNCQMNVLG